VATASLNEPAPGAASNPRAEALTLRIEGLARSAEASDTSIDAVALGVVDALLDDDGMTLRAALRGLRDARVRALDAGDASLAGALDALIATAHWGVERLPEAAPVARGTRAWSFLEALSQSDPLGSSELRERLGTDETQVSRTGRQLLEAGLVSRSRTGRHVSWRLTPRGRHAIDTAEEPPARERGESSFWMEAIRRGFEGAGGDMPGERRTVDPTYERIVERTLELHTMDGIAEASWDEIAARAGVPVETVHAYFPTLDDMIRGCGQHMIERLRVPPPERAAEVFAGAATQPERVRRLVDTIFDVYEREAPQLERGLIDRATLPLVDDAIATVDVAIDALVGEALERTCDERTVASVRALTDLTVWRALRDRGTSAEASAEQTAAVVESWLEGRAAPA
jgi:AcrR family transcriptional regulator